MLYRVATIAIYGCPRDPRISYRVWRVSDTVRLGRQQETAGLLPIEPPTAASPTAWLQQALAQAPMLQGPAPDYGRTCQNGG